MGAIAATLAAACKAERGVRRWTSSPPTTELAMMAM